MLICPIISKFCCSERSFFLDKALGSCTVYWTKVCWPFLPLASLAIANPWNTEHSIHFWRMRRPKKPVGKTRKTCSSHGGVFLCSGQNARETIQNACDHSGVSNATTSTFMKKQTDLRIGSTRDGERTRSLMKVWLLHWVVKLLCSKDWFVLLEWTQSHLFRCVTFHVALQPVCNVTKRNKRKSLTLCIKLTFPKTLLSLFRFVKKKFEVKRNILVFTATLYTLNVTAVT